MIRRSRSSVQSRRHQAASAAAQVPHWRPQVTGQGLLSGPATASATQAGPPRRRRLGRAGHGCLALPCRPALRARPRPGACACPTARADPAPGPRASSPQMPHRHSVADAQSRCHRPRAAPARGPSSLGRRRRGRAKAAAPRRTHVSLTAARPAACLQRAQARPGGESSLRPGSTRRRQPCKWKITKGRARPPNLLDPSSSTVHSAPLKG